MDIDVDLCLADLSSSFEEMDTNESESKVLKDRSELMDKKSTWKGFKKMMKRRHFSWKEKGSIRKEKEGSRKEGWTC